MTLDEALGPRPWKYLGHTIEKYQAGQTSAFSAGVGPVQCGASCDYCATAIMETHHFECADGTRFKVGSTCVGKMLKLVRADRALTKAQRAIRKIRNERSKVRKMERYNERKAKLEELLTTHESALKAKPHPNQWRADQGDTMFDYYQFCARNANETTLGKLLRKIEGIFS